MRLAVLEDGHRLRARLFMALASRMAGAEDVDDVFKTILYRPALFGGRAWGRLFRRSLRGSSDWTVGERELFAAVISQVNSCNFCTDAHCGTATLTLGRTITPSMLENREPVGLRPEVVAMIGLLEKVTRTPELVSSGDVAGVRAVGVSDEAIADALAICFAFNMLNRLADVFGYSWHSEHHRTQGIRALVRFGYRIPNVVLR